MELSREVELDYFEVVDRNDLSALEVIDPKLGAVACLAATVGGVRLIDNIQLEPR
jgi:pantothenate synthetase